VPKKKNEAPRSRGIPEKKKIKGTQEERKQVKKERTPQRPPPKGGLSIEHREVARCKQTVRKKGLRKKGKGIRGTFQAQKKNKKKILSQKKKSPIERAPKGRKQIYNLDANLTAKRSIGWEKPRFLLWRREKKKRKKRGRRPNPPVVREKFFFRGEKKKNNKREGKKREIHSRV